MRPSIEAILYKNGSNTHLYNLLNGYFACWNTDSPSKFQTVMIVVGEFLPRRTCPEITLENIIGAIDSSKSVEYDTVLSELITLLRRWQLYLAGDAKYLINAMSSCDPNPASALVISRLIEL